MRTVPRAAAVAAVGVGGAIGAMLRWTLYELSPDGGGFPWTTLAINVLGSLLLAALPAVAYVRRRPVLVVLLGPGLLGGFTTLSTWSEQTRALVADGQAALAGAYVVATLAACLLAAVAGARVVVPADEQRFVAQGGEE